METTETKLAKAALKMADELHGFRWMPLAIGAICMITLLERVLTKDHSDDSVLILCFFGVVGVLLRVLQVLELLLRDRARSGGQQAAVGAVAKPG